jgi:hypothetical protein
MMARELTLDQLQTWLLETVTRSGTSEPEMIEQLICPSRQQSASERLAVYQNAYVARLLEVLRELFPCTRFAVGDELFDQFAAGYLEAYPPRSYTLGRLADHWVDYLEATRPADWGEFVVEVARLEQVIDRIFDAPGPENLPPFVMPVEPTAMLRLEFVPGLELHAFQFPVSRYFTEWKAGRQPGWPEQVRQFVALFRREYVVRRHELTDEQYELLVALGCRMPLGEAISRVISGNSGDADELAGEVRRWFELWSAERFFAAANCSSA